MNKEVFFSQNEPVAEQAGANGVPVLDVGLGTRCAWASAKTLVEQLIEGRGEVVYGEMLVNGYKMGTLDLFLDDPASLEMPEIGADAAGNELHTYKEAGMAVALCAAAPTEAPKGAGFVVATKNTGVVASVYQSYLRTVQTVREVLKAGFGAEQLVWGWSTMVMPPLCDDAARFAGRLAAATENGSIISLWLRTDSDEDVKACLKGLSKRGELRLQNLKTANTFILGSVDEAAVAKGFGIG